MPEPTSERFDPIKVSGGFMVPAELLQDAVRIPSPFLREKSETQYQAEQERRRVARDMARASAVARHAAARPTVDPVLIPVLDHHGPNVPEGWGGPQVYCEGCDPGLNAEADAEWPCSTWLLITGEQA